MGIYASVLNALGMVGRIADLVDPSTDELGLRLTSPAAQRREKAERRARALKKNEPKQRSVTKTPQ